MGFVGHSRAPLCARLAQRNWKPRATGTQMAEAPPFWLALWATAIERSARQQNRSLPMTLKLGKAAPTPAPADAKGRARAKVVAHLEQQKELLAALLEGRAFEATRPVY